MGGKAAAGEGVGGDAGRLSRLEPRQLALGHEYAGLERRGIGDAKYRRAYGQFLAQLHVALRHDAGKRRADRAVRKIELRDVVRGALIVEIVFEVLEGAGGYQSLLVQLDLSIEVTLGLGECGARLGGLQPQLPIVELREHLAGAHAIAFLDEDLAYLTAHLGDDFGIGLGFESRRAAVHGEHLSAYGPGDFDGYGGFGLGLGFFFRGGLVAGHSIPGAGTQAEYEQCDAGSEKNCLPWPHPLVVAFETRQRPHWLREGRSLWGSGVVVNYNTIPVRACSAGVFLLAAHGARRD